MNISAALGYPFRGPHAWSSFGCRLVCMLIPIIGPIVLSGYLIQAEKRLLENSHADLPPFDFGKFGIYLQRGLQPFLASLVFTLFFMLLLLPLGVAAVLAVILLQKQVLALVIALAVIALAYVVEVGLFGLVAAPLLFKAGLEGAFISAFDLAYLKAYVARVGWLTLGVQLLMVALLVPLMIVLCIPMVGPALGLSVFMPIQTHLSTQLYVTYLERGGTPLAIMPEPVEAGAFPIIPPPAPTAP